MTAPRAAHPVRDLGVLCGVFFGAGFMLASFGPSLPALATQTGETLDRVGRLMPAIFVGGIAAQFVAGRASDRLGRRLVLTAALVVLGLTGTAISLAPTLSVVLGAAAGFGFAYGSFSLAGNVLSTELVPTRRASAVNLVNMFFGLGAVAGPLVVSVLLKRTGQSLPALWIGAGVLAVMALLSALTLPDHLPAAAVSKDAKAAGRTASLRDPTLFACGIFLLLYVGSEMAAGAWAASYLQQSAYMEPARAAAATSLFWAMLTAGRVAAVVAGMRLASETLLTTSVWIACLGSVLLWGGHGVGSASVVALAIMGFGYGPIYPTSIAVLTTRYPHAAGTATSQMGILASIGGGLVPWLHGVVLARRPSADSALLTVGIAIATIAAWEITRRLAHRS